VRDPPRLEFDQEEREDRAEGHVVGLQEIAYPGFVSVVAKKRRQQLLEGMFIGFRVTAFSGSPRKSLLSTERFCFFDVGVHNAAAELPLETAAIRANPGPVFEQWVGIELWKRLQYLGDGKLHYLRTKAGAEVDFIIARGGTLVPIEVKWTEHPTPGDARHLLTFLDEHPKRARHGYVICRCATPLSLTNRVTALPWSHAGHPGHRADAEAARPRPRATPKRGHGSRSWFPDSGDLLVVETSRSAWARRRARPEGDTHRPGRGADVRALSRGAHLRLGALIEVVAQVQQQERGVPPGRRRGRRRELHWIGERRNRVPATRHA
jgi:hypothetical protein